MARRFLTPPQLPSGSSLPTSGVAGALFFKSDEGKIYVHDGTTWVIAQGSGGSGGGVVVSATAPANPTEGTYWFDSTNTKSYIYYDSFWIEVGDSGGGYIVSDTAPTSPSEGDVWFNSSEGVIYVYYDSFWVDPSTGGAAGVPAGGTTGQVLAKSSNTDYATSWVNPASAVSALTDVTLTSVQNGQTLVYNTSTSKWVNSTPSSNLDSLTDVTISSPQNNQTLVYNSSTGAWQNGVGGSTTTVSESAPSTPSVGDTWFKSSTGQHFIYYDSYWVELGVGPQGPEGPSGVLAATSPITYDSGTKTVGINQGAINIAASQITNLTASVTELNYVDGVTSSVQTQLDSKASTGKAIAMAMVFG